jgi:hypothetical protein
MLIKRFYEGDSGDNPAVPPVIAEAPATVVHTMQAVPATSDQVAEHPTQLPHEAINRTLEGLTSATQALTEAANRLGQTAAPVVTEPIEATQNAPEIVADVQPSIEPPPPETRYVRRNGRKVKR